VLTQRLAVECYCRRRHDALEVDEDAATILILWRHEVSPIDVNELVVAIVEAVPRESAVGVGHSDALKAGVVEIRIGAFWHRHVVVQPTPVQGKHASDRAQASILHGRRATLSG
jgi:hypothetical protein